MSAVVPVAWFNALGSDVCPPDMVPDAEALAEWWESDRLLMDVLAASKEATQSLTLLLDAQDSFWVVHQGALKVASIPLRSSAVEAETHTIEQIHESWIAKRDMGTGHPLRPIISAWHKRPVGTTANTRPDRIMPSRVAMVNQGDSRALPRADRPGLFSPAAYLEDDQMSLPGFGVPRQSDLPVLPLALYDPGMKGSKHCGIRLTTTAAAPVSCASLLRAETARDP